MRVGNPDLGKKAGSWSCPAAKHHGFAKMSDIMTALNPLTGALYGEGLEFTRLSREMFVVLAGKYPHPQTVVPRGVSTTVSLSTLTEYHSHLSTIFHYGRPLIT